MESKAGVIALFRWPKKVLKGLSVLWNQGIDGFWTELQLRLDWPRGKVFSHGKQVGRWLAKMETRRPYRISVVVPTLSGGNDLRALLESLAHQKGCLLDVIVLDSGSRDGSREVVGLYPMARWFDVAPGEFSHSETRNRGVALAKYPLVLLTVQDAILPRDTALYEMAEILHHRGLVALSASETPRPDADAYARYNVNAFHTGIGLTEESTLVHSAWLGRPREKIRAASIGNVCCLYRTKALRRWPLVGTFGEDFTVAIRFLQRGMAVGKTSEVMVVHSHTRPAFYALKRMYVSRKLMTSLQLVEGPREDSEAAYLNMVSGMACFFAEGWVSIRQLDPAIWQWVQTLEVDFSSPSIASSAPHATLVAIVDEVLGVEPHETAGTEALILKALAGRLGWELGATDPGLWTTDARRKAIEGLAQGV